MSKRHRDSERYPSIGAYALIGDCHSAALVSRAGSIDWCCTPRMDSGSCFGRILDWDRGGHCSVRATGTGEADDVHIARSYLDNTMVLETMFRTGAGEARVLDCFTIREGGAVNPDRRLLRVLEGIRGTVEFQIELVVRFDYGDLAPWVRFHSPGVWSAVGGNDALLVRGDLELQASGDHDMVADVTVRAGERARLALTAVAPESLGSEQPPPEDPDELDRRLDETIEWWRRWSAKINIDGPDASAVRRSATVLKALTNAPTGAIAAAPTTSLPEAEGGARNWDYRYSWVRDSQFTVRALAELGADAEADGFRRFIERSAAGSADSLQIMYGLGGQRRLPELELPLEGYRGSAPVRVGNLASEQRQLDVYGELLDLSWKWHLRGQSPDDDYWRFLLSLVDAAADKWSEPDAGLWEMRGEPQHFVHSKVMCWATIDRGLMLAEACLRQAPTRRWQKVRDEIRRSVEHEGVDQDRNCFVQRYGATDLDGALLLLPTVDFVPYDDPRMVATVDAVVEELSDDGLVRRYRAPDGLEGEEGTFLACTFWLVECLAFQGRISQARAAYDRAVAAANDLGLYAEEVDATTGEALGNFPQGLTHLSHIAAAVALNRTAERA